MLFRFSSFGAAWVRVMARNLRGWCWIHWGDSLHDQTRIAILLQSFWTNAGNSFCKITQILEGFFCRAWMIFCAVAGPIPVILCNCSSLAVFASISVFALSGIVIVASMMRQIKESFRAVNGRFVAWLVLTRCFVNRLVLTLRFATRLAVTSFEITAVVLVQTGLSQPIELIPRMIGLIGCSAWNKSLITDAILP